MGNQISLFQESLEYVVQHQTFLGPMPVYKLNKNHQTFIVRFDIKFKLNQHLLSQQKNRLKFLMNSQTAYVSPVHYYRESSTEIQCSRLVDLHVFCNYLPISLRKFVQIYNKPLQFNMLAFLFRQLIELCLIIVNQKNNLIPMKVIDINHIYVLINGTIQIYPVFSNQQSCYESLREPQSVKLFIQKQPNQISPKALSWRAGMLILQVGLNLPSQKIFFKSIHGQYDFSLINRYIYKLEDIYSSSISKIVQLMLIQSKHQRIALQEVQTRLKNILSKCTWEGPHGLVMQYKLKKIKNQQELDSKSTTLDRE